MRVRKLTFTALAVATALSLTACNDEDVTGQSDPSAASTSSPAPDDAGSDNADQDAGNESDGKDSAAGGGSDSGSENGQVEKCLTDALEVSASDATVGGDEEGMVAVEFKNGGGKDCSLAPFAGVDLKTNSGTISAERTSQKADTTILKDGDSIFFGITYPMNDTGGSGVRITKLVVTPPNETKSVSLDWPGAASLPVTDGSSGTPVRVGPMGSAGQGEG